MNINIENANITISQGPSKMEAAFLGAILRPSETGESDLRDEFAGMAMQSQIIGVEGIETTCTNIRGVAAFSYAMADAMMEARQV